MSSGVGLIAPIFKDLPTFGNDLNLARLSSFEAKRVDPRLRQTAIAQMERQQAAIAARPSSLKNDALLAAWTPIGPAPIPNGYVVGPTPMAVSGRVTAITSYRVFRGTTSSNQQIVTSGGFFI